jgi:hypothetical protein
MPDNEPKIIVKPNLVIFKDTEHWDGIWQKILSEYGSTIAISWVLKRELGFTIRRHTHWINFFADGAKVGGYSQDQIHLDFYNESALSWFQLKYL